MATKRADAEKDKMQHDAQSSRDEALKSWQNLYPDLLKAVGTGDSMALDKAYEAVRLWKEKYQNTVGVLNAEEKKGMRDELDLVFDKAKLLRKAASIMKGPFSDVGKNAAAAKSALNMLLRALDTENKLAIDAAATKALPVLGRFLDSTRVRPLLTGKINLDMREFRPDEYKNTLARGFRPIDMLRWNTNGVTFWRQDENCYAVTNSTPKYSLTWEQLNIMAATKMTWSIGPFVIRHEDAVKLLGLKGISYTNMADAKVVEKIMSA